MAGPDREPAHAHTPGRALRSHRWKVRRLPPAVDAKRPMEKVIVITLRAPSPDWHDHEATKPTRAMSGSTAGRNRRRDRATRLCPSPIPNRTPPDISAPAANTPGRAAHGLAPVATSRRPKTARSSIYPYSRIPRSAKPCARPRKYPCHGLKLPHVNPTTAIATPTCNLMQQSASKD